VYSDNQINYENGDAMTDLKIKNFWAWFVERKALFDKFEENRELLTPEIVEQLKVFPQNLVVEIEPPQNGSRRMAISADGIETTFPLVRSIVAAAPHLKGWQIVAFRQPGPLAGIKLNYPGITLETSKMWIFPMESSGGFDCIIYFSNYSEEKRNLFINATYVLLDDAIGEYNVVKGIRTLDFKKLPPEGERDGIVPFVDLPKVFADYEAKHRT
jgi:hypothetical protein